MIEVEQITIERINTSDGYEDPFVIVKYKREGVRCVNHYRCISPQAAEDLMRMIRKPGELK